MKSVRIKFYILKIRNFIYFEITLKDRITLFLNHVENLLTNNKKFIDFKEIKIVDIHVISLNFRLDRRKKIIKQFSDFDIRFSFMDAKKFIKNGNESNYFSQNSINYLSHGALSCASSHVSLWEKIADQNKDEYHLIFEDDIILNYDYKNCLNSLTKTYPSDADIFFLGTQNVRLRDTAFFTQFNYCRSFNCRLGAYAYIVSTKSAKKILNVLLPLNLICGGIDTAIGIAVRQKKINAYRVNLNIVFHENDVSSNIYNPSVPQKKLHSSAIRDWPNFS